jgi:hypothetical protein
MVSSLQVGSIGLPEHSHPRDGTCVGALPGSGYRGVTQPLSLNPKTLTLGPETLSPETLNWSIPYKQ